MSLAFSQKITPYDFLGLCSFVTSPQADMKMTFSHACKGGRHTLNLDIAQNVV